MFNSGKISGLLLKLALLGIIAVISACGSNTENPKNQNEVINIGRLICGGHLPLAVVEKKYQQDLKSFHLKTIQNHDWNDVVADMHSGKLSGTFMLSPLAMNLIHNGFPGKIILKADRNGNGFVLSKKLKSIDQLKTRKSIIAVPHVYSQHNVLLHMVLQQHKIPEDNVIVLGMPPRDMISSLKNGEIDGFVVGEPEGNKAVSLNVGWMAAISPGIWKDHMDHVFLATNSFINEKPEEVQELINNLVKAGQFIESNPSEAAIMGVDYTGSEAHVFEQVLTSPPDWIDYSDMVMTPSDIHSMAEKMVEMKLWSMLPKDLDRYIDSTFVNKAKKVQQ
jgi:NitT/TauT family transport system substrate-binding protein